MLKHVEKYAAKTIAEPERALYVIPWSGGVDSTLAVNIALMGGHRVMAITFEGKDLYSTNQLAGQRAAMAKYTKWTADRGFRFLHVVEQVSIPEMRRNELCQAQLWLFWTLMMAPNGSRVLFPYIKGDSFFENFKSVPSFIEQTKALVESDVEVVFPFEDRDKSQIVDEFRRTGFTLADTWTCDVVLPIEDGAKPSQCGSCGKCTTLRDAADRWGIKSGIPNAPVFDEMKKSVAETTVSQPRGERIGGAKLLKEKATKKKPRKGGVRIPNPSRLR